MNYYNEIDPKAAAWLRELIKQNLIPNGIVDTRSITEIKPNELKQYTQCHFFAGIGGWSLALQLAGWPATRPVWTGSCPCQPFSTAGKQLGNADERHLWPIFFNLIRECRPDTVFGEQVANAIGKGWLDGVSSDLEGAGYACGAAVLGAHSVSSPHIRQRLYWVANATGAWGCWRGSVENWRAAESGGSSPTGGLADASSKGYKWGERSRETGEEGLSSGHACERGSDCGLGHSGDPRLQGHGQLGDLALSQGRQGAERHAAPSGSFWSDYELIPCADGKARRIEPGLAPLAHGVSGRVVRLRGYGNAIVPQVAAAFVQAYIDVT